ncbi:uncharacterized protein I206_107684 [Kwoniella pini CBS 10737]|uniref:BRCA2 OB1 domain-containing protein n=1 Tax=Kwoniella pini CBS 10737 TaxID=1296096 RepID=A0A1B9HY23_9TREE|nr:uncharacterized protein I206_06019 [Kwoniella pini CBS 10737]OCF48151.1 hypothetical protein I206_06019 [Kwoniella pini CBS 10737]
MPLIEEEDFDFPLAGPSSLLQAPPSSATRPFSPIPDANLPTDFGDLLDGLAADDLDDFGDIDAEDIRNDKSFEEAHPNPAEFDDSLVGETPNLVQIPTMVGFATGRGTKLKPPSKESIARASKLWAGEEEEEGKPDQVQPTKKPRLSDPSEDDFDLNIEEEEMIDFPMDFVGFKTGRNKIVAPPKAESLQRASKLFNEIDQALAIEEAQPSSSIPTSSFQKAILQTPTNIHKSEFPPTGGEGLFAAASLQGTQRTARPLDDVDEHNDIQPSSSFPNAPELPRGSGFALASGSAAPRLSHGSVKQALNILNVKEDAYHSRPSLQSESAFRTASSRPTTTYHDSSTSGSRDCTGETENEKPISGFKSASGKQVAAINATSRAAVANLFNDLDTNMVTPSRPRPQEAAHSAARNNASRTTSFMRPRSTQGSNPPSTPLRTPTSNPASLARRPIQIKTPSGPIRRIGLGSTPGQRQAKKGFNTPFKTGGGTSYFPPIPVQDPGASMQREVSHYQPIFDLESIPDRRNYKAAFLHPQYCSKDELKEMGIPDDIFAINLETSPRYSFLGDNAISLGPEAALDALHADGGEFAKASWVVNHWSQILWKLAGQVQAKPTLFSEKWDWDEVIRQLKYRYEREYGCAERSVIKRIQEHDSPAALPMVLVISAVHHTEAEDKKSMDYLLELTDGWYRIKAHIDECLSQAVLKGRIAVGRKIAVSGAKLESSNDGTDVLEALNNSRLIISGNSTSFARWTAKLGKQPRPFIASLSSLSADGGIISLMDVILEKVFPIAYMGKGESPWGEEEEQIRQDAWINRYEGEKTRLADKTRKELERMEDLASLLAQSAEESESVNPDPPDSLENDYERLLESRDALGCLRSMNTHQIVHLAGYANIRISQEMQEKQFEMESELASICPRREARDFRMIRFVDAQTGNRDPFRVGMLNVWDVKAMGEGVLEEGKRYLVSNLFPGKTGDWSTNRNRSDKAEVYLHTRRDTRWQPVE